nr:molybdopterin-dependent oxidoreductase [Nitrosomonas sp.]
LAQHHPDYTDIHGLAQEISQITGADFGTLGEAANSIGAYFAGAVPGQVAQSSMDKSAQTPMAGLNAAQMLGSDAQLSAAPPCQGYVLMNMEPEYDTYHSHKALNTLKSAEFVVSMSTFRGNAMEYADVLLPIAPFTETSGTFINTEGRVQSFNGVVPPLGEARPAWKVLRVLGNLLQLDGFDFETPEQVRNEIFPIDADISGHFNNQLASHNISIPEKNNGRIHRIGEVPIYQADPIVRRAESLQQTNDAAKPQALMSAALLERLNINAGDNVSLKQDDGEVRLKAGRDDKIPDNCVRVVCAHPDTAPLGAMFGEVIIEKL